MVIFPPGPQVAGDREQQREKTADKVNNSTLTLSFTEIIRLTTPTGSDKADKKSLMCMTTCVLFLCHVMYEDFITCHNVRSADFPLAIVWGRGSHSLCRLPSTVDFFRASPPAVCCRRRYLGVHWTYFHSSQNSKSVPLLFITRQIHTPCISVSVQNQKKPSAPTHTSPEHTMHRKGDIITFVMSIKQNPFVAWLMWVCSAMNAVSLRCSLKGFNSVHQRYTWN